MVQLKITDSNFTVWKHQPYTAQCHLKSNKKLSKRYVWSWNRHGCYKIADKSGQFLEPLNLLSSTRATLNLDIYTLILLLLLSIRVLRMQKVKMKHEMCVVVHGMVSWIAIILPLNPTLAMNMDTWFKWKIDLVSSCFMSAHFDMHRKYRLIKKSIFRCNFSAITMTHIKIFDRRIFH